MGSTAEKYDFIVVGGGTAGCLFAYRLAHAPSAPSVLVVEVGGENLEDNLVIPSERYTSAFTNGRDPGYASIPQKQLRGREIPYTRGTGLGGSSFANFMQYSRGSATDYDEWARIVGDDAWKWESTKERFKRLENHHDDTPKEWKKYVAPNAEDHGYDGPIDVNVPPKWEKVLGIFMDSVAGAGYRINPDHNSGDVLGWSVSISSTDGRTRTTSASKTMRNRPHNLRVRTNSKVAKVIVQNGVANGVAIGVVLVDGTKIFANRDVILSAGPFDTPKILLLSGIGPSSELSELAIPVTHHLPGVGKNLKDHYCVYLISQVDGSLSDRNAIVAADTGRMPRDRWLDDTTGFYANHFNSLAIGYYRDESLLATPEFQQLDLDTKTFLTNKNIPSFEVIGAIPNIIVPGLHVDEGSTSAILLVAVHNAQSSGSVTLQSKDPEDKPVIDNNYLDHPFDRAIMCHAVRAARKVMMETALRRYWQKDVAAPESYSDEDILTYAEKVVMPEFHANGTAKMGPSSDPMACVDTNFRVYGVQGLRVVDLSVCPLTPNAHTQGPAYVIAETAAEKIIKEYGLDRL